MRPLAALLTVLVLSGCAMTTWVTTPNDVYHHASCKFTARLPSQWMKHDKNHRLTMTRDGIILDLISVSRHALAENLDSTKKLFTKDMLPQELAEVEMDNFRTNPDLRRFAILSQEPLKISGHNGFRFEYTCQYKTGLEKRGIQYGFIVGDHVYRLNYEAADGYYYRETVLVFEEFLKSFQLDPA